ADDAWELLAERGFADQAAVPNVLRALALNAGVLASWFGSELRNARLSKRDQELVILRVAHRCGAHYIWSKHADGPYAVALPYMSPEAMEEIRRDSTSTTFDARERLLLAAVDSCVARSTIDPTIREPLAGSIGEAGVLELIHLVARYLFLASALNTF